MIYWRQSWLVFFRQAKVFFCNWVYYSLAIFLSCILQLGSLFLTKRCPVIHFLQLLFNIYCNCFVCYLQLVFSIFFFMQIFMPACSGKHYFVYYINLIHNRIDILDSIDYLWGNTSPKTRHRPVYNKIPIISAAFQNVTNNKFPRFERWSSPFIDLPKQSGPTIACSSFGNTWNTGTASASTLTSILWAHFSAFFGPIHACDLSFL